MMDRVQKTAFTNSRMADLTQYGKLFDRYVSNIYFIFQIPHYIPTHFQAYEILGSHSAEDVDFLLGFDSMWTCR
jgi:hypothetical protein